MIALALAVSLRIAEIAGAAAPLAVAQAQIESDGDPLATECPRSPAARTARRHYDDYRFASPRAPCFCGLLQTTAASPDLCLLQRAPIFGIAAWRAQRAAWRSICRRRGARDLELCTIAGYAVGGAGVLAALGHDGGRQGARGLGYARRLLRRAASISPRYPRSQLRPLSAVW